MNFPPGFLARTRAFAFASALVVAIISLAGASILASRAMAEAERIPANSAEAPFLAENDAAMSRMMASMAVKPTGDVDHDFVEMMVAHHQGAIDMAKAFLRYGKNEQLRLMAQQIIVAQQQEIAAMRLALGEPLPPSVPSPTAVEPGSASSPAANDTMDNGAMSHGTRSHDSNSMKMK